MQFDTVVVGLDFTESSQEVVGWVARVIAPRARLVLVHAVSVPEPPGFFKGRFPSSDELVENARRGAEERMRQAVAQLDLENVQIDIRVGAPAEQIGSAARDTGAELIVVGPHAERPGVWRLIGGTAQRLARGAPCPVLIARGMTEHAPSRILVPLDESELTAVVLRHAVALAQRFDATLVLMHVISDSLLGATRIGSTPGEQRDAARSLHESAEEWLRAQLAGTGAVADGARLEVRAGDAAHEILAAVEALHCDLVVMGRSGAGRVGELILGSVANSVLRNGSGPLLLVGPD